MQDGHSEEAIAKARAEAKRRQMKLAAMIEPDPQRVHQWWTEEPITELGSLTADQLVAQGMECLVEKFLLSIIFDSCSVCPVY